MVWIILGILAVVASMTNLFTRYQNDKKTLLILMACASLTIVNSAKAALGWSLLECQDHYGTSLRSESESEYGRQKYVFRTGEYDISVWLFDDMVTSIRYKKVDGNAISSNEI